MKKVFITLCVIMMTAVSVFADGGNGGNRYLQSRFTQNWFISISGNVSCFEGSDFKLNDLSTVYGPHFGGSLALGKMVNPNVSIRLGYDIHPSSNRFGQFMHKFVHVDGIVSLNDLFAGYRNDRIYRISLMAGFGLLGYDTDMHKYFITKSSYMEYGAQLGLINSFRLNKSLEIHIDLTQLFTRWSYDNDPAQTEGFERLRMESSASLGLNWYLGGRHFDVPEQQAADCSKYEEQVNGLNSQISQLQKDLADCRTNLTNAAGTQPCDTIVKFVEGESLSYPFSIFFNKGSYELRDGRDRVNLQEFANAAKQNGYKIVLRGTCDSATASASFNRTLAENRCNKVKAELVKLGVAESNITIQPVGGVKELTPTEYDRRVLIQLSK